MDKLLKEIKFWIKDWEAEGRPYGVNGITRKIGKLISKYLKNNI